jgi:hypothetical protein
VAAFRTSIIIENNAWVGRVFNEDVEVYKTNPSQDQLRIAKDLMNYFTEQQVSYTAKEEPMGPRVPVTFFSRKCCGR